MQHELVLDPAIRDWVFLPLIVIMFLVGILRHNATSLLRSDPKPGDKEQVKQSMALMRSRRLRANARYIPEEAYHARRHYFSHPTTGVFSQKLEAPPNALAMMSDPDVMQNMMKGNMATMVPQVAMMGVVNQFFSGFVLVKIPFPLTPSFKSMLQRGIPLASLDVTYVTSLSWYFIVMFGMQGLFRLVLGGSEEDESALMMSAGMGMMPGMMPGGAMPGQPVDNKKNFEQERENLSLVEHKWALAEAEDVLLAGVKLAGASGARRGAPAKAKSS
ncbi:hypothetical protein KFE25_002431 [Diacronema lutheri]|uniref:ER membrane protein complex subunit 3 n=2 Tax=Diacronema lutheri TaxID=2081491 RepID=A0A8J6C400_DIALT|nr:hypothetical protein KFE25_002431 [Diacronema lutheri]